MPIGDKLDALLKIKNKKPGTLATETGIPKSTIYSIIKRNNGKVSYSVIESIADNLNVPVEYFFDSSTTIPSETQTQSSFAAELSQDENKLLSAYRSLNDSGKAAALSMVEGLQYNPTFSDYYEEEKQA